MLEIDGHGRAAFALVANADPYTYVGRLPLRLPRGARLEGGLDLLAPRLVARSARCRARSRYLLTGRTRLPLLELHDVDRIEIRCDAPMPLQLDGEDLGDVDRGRASRPSATPSPSSSECAALTATVRFDMSAGAA